MELAQEDQIGLSSNQALQDRERECDQLRSQMATMAAKLASTEEKLQQEKNKVKEVIQAQRDVRRSINASASKRDSDFGSPGQPDLNLQPQNSSSKAGRRRGVP